MQKMLLAMVLVALIAVSPVLAHAVPESEFYAKANEMRGAKKADQRAIISYAENVLKETPDASPKMRALALSMIGEAYGKLGEIDKGMTFIRDSLKIQDTSFGYVQLTNLYLGKKDYHAAIDAVQKAVALADVKDQERLKKEIIRIQETYLTVSANALYAAFDENEVAAEDQYKGKPIFVKGTISAITTDPAGYPVVSLDAGKSGFAKVNCVFPKDARPTIGKLKKGSQVLISGVCSGMTMQQIFIKNCTVD